MSFHENMYNLTDSSDLSSTSSLGIESENIVFIMYFPLSIKPTSQNLLLIEIASNCILTVKISKPTFDSVFQILLLPPRPSWVAF